MSAPDFALAAWLAQNAALSTVEMYYGPEMLRLVTRLKRLPEWERLRPTPAIAEREWKLMVQKDRVRAMNRRKARRQQKRLP
jgi:hypothetical protein